MGALTLLITGAAGYIGRATVAAALDSGHRVIAVARQPGQAAALEETHPAVTSLTCDLNQPSEALDAALDQADCVIHCAGGPPGGATEGLLRALPDGSKLVHVSSIAVYGFADLEPGSLIEDDAALERHPERRDAYAAVKIAEERAVMQASAAKGLALTVLRPGAVFGPGRLWNAHLGKRIGPVLLRFGRSGQIPLAHIDLTAAALVAAAERPPLDPVMVVDEDLPDRPRYLAALQGGPTLIVPLPQWLLAPVMSVETRAARYRPLGFDNTRMRSVLGVHDTRGFERLMHEAQMEAGA